MLFVGLCAGSSDFSHARAGQGLGGTYIKFRVGDRTVQHGASILHRSVTQEHQTGPRTRAGVLCPLSECKQAPPALAREQASKTEREVGGRERARVRVARTTPKPKAQQEK